MFLEFSLPTVTYGIGGLLPEKISPAFLQPTNNYIVYRNGIFLLPLPREPMPGSCTHCNV
jgi:hypothetical protein